VSSPVELVVVALQAGGGDHHTMFAVTYEDLLRVTAGEAAAVA
jgi:hypothetical protein